ncbi:MAG: head fiber protein [Fusobacterium sp.]|nr:head fiber protein [Fusobacterium sp.]MDO5789191.1 head fiber protein [Fusobacterium sp.]
MEKIVNTLANGNKLIDEVAYDLLAREVIALIKTKANSSHTHSADQVTETDTRKFVTTQEKADWNAKITQQQLDQAIQTLASGLAFKGVYETLDALNTGITQPQEGYMVIVTKEPTYSGKNTILIYEGEPTNAWQTVGELFVPGLATTTQDGLMSKTDKAKLDGLENYNLPVANTTRLGGVKQGSNITIAEDGTISTHAPYSHPDNHPATMITQDTTHRFTTDTEKTKWNQAATDATAAKNTAESALQKATTNEENISALGGRVTEIETTLTNTMTEEEAQAIITKYKGA